MLFKHYTASDDEMQADPTPLLFLLIWLASVFPHYSKKLCTYAAT